MEERKRKKKKRRRNADASWQGLLVGSGTNGIAESFEKRRWEFVIRRGVAASLTCWGGKGFHWKRKRYMGKTTMNEIAEKKMRMRRPNQRKCRKEKRSSVPRM